MKSTLPALSGREWNGTVIRQRVTDGYVNATAMAKANGKHLPHYIANARTTAYIAELASVVGIPTTGTDGLIQTRQGGRPELQGTWVHPRLAIDLARWISPAFAVWMDGWFLDWLQSHPQPVEPEPTDTLLPDAWPPLWPEAHVEPAYGGWRTWNRYRTDPVERWLRASDTTKLGIALCHLMEDYELGMVHGTNTRNVIGMAAAAISYQFHPVPEAFDRTLRVVDPVERTCAEMSHAVLTQAMEPIAASTAPRRKLSAAPPRGYRRRPTG